MWPRLIFRNVWFLLVREIRAYEVVRSGCRIRYQVGRNLILFVNKKVIFYANASIKLYLFSGLFLYILVFHLESLFNASICVKFQGGATFKAASIIQRLTRNNGARIFVVSNFGSWLLALGFFRLSWISDGASSWVTPKGTANSGKVDKFGQHLVMP